MLSETRRSAAPPFRALAANRSAASTQVPISVEMQIFPWGPSLGNAKFPCAQVAPLARLAGWYPRGN